MAKRDRSGTRLIRVPVAVADVIERIKEEAQPRRMTSAAVIERALLSGNWVNPHCLEPLRKAERGRRDH